MTMMANTGMLSAALYVLSGISTASIEQFLLLEGASGTWLSRLTCTRSVAETAHMEEPALVFPAAWLLLLLQLSHRPHPLPPPPPPLHFLCMMTFCVRQTHGAC